MEVACGYAPQRAAGHQDVEQRLTLIQGYFHFFYCIIQPIKLKEDSDEERAGSSKIVVFLEGLPKVSLSLLKMLPAGIRILC